MNNTEKTRPQGQTKAIEVICRLRNVPFPLNTCPYYNINTDANTINIEADAEVLQKISNIDKYSFAHLFNEEASQVEFFTSVSNSCFRSLFEENRSSLLFAYGVSNSGKTYTVIGQKAKEGKGLVPRFLHQFIEIKQGLRTHQHSYLEKKFDFLRYSLRNGQNRQTGVNGDEMSRDGGSVERSWEMVDLVVKIEVFEIYNNKVYDLLAGYHPKKGNKPQNTVFQPVQKPLKIYEENRVVKMKGLTTVNIVSEEQIRQVLKLYKKNRSSSNNNLNKNSSRSHTIFKVHTTAKYKSSASQNSIAQQFEEKLGSLYIVDLAGTERLKRTQNVSSERLKEAASINESLMNLRRCLNAIRMESDVPYRNSMLTRVLSEAFRFRFKVKMIVNVNPSLEDFFESARALNFAVQVKRIKRESILRNTVKQHNVRTPLRGRQTRGKMSAEGRPMTAESFRSFDLVSERKLKELDEKVVLVQTMRKELKEKDGEIVELKENLCDRDEKVGALVDEIERLRDEVRDLRNTERLNQRRRQVRGLNEFKDTCLAEIFQKNYLLDQLTMIYD